MKNFLGLVAALAVGVTALSNASQSSILIGLNKGAENPSVQKLYVAPGAEIAIALANSRLFIWGHDNFYVPGLEMIQKFNDVLNFAYNGNDFICIERASNGWSCLGSNTKLSPMPTPVGKIKKIELVRDVGCFLDQVGLKCWGDNTYGQTAQLKTSPLWYCQDDGVGFKCSDAFHAPYYITLDIPSPQELETFNDFSVSEDDETICAKSDSSVRCWGSNNWYGDELPRFSQPQFLSINGGHGCGVEAGEVKCWGKMDYDYFARYRPIPGDDVAISTPKNLKNPTALITCGITDCVIDEGNLNCWGDTERPDYQRIKDRVHHVKFAAIGAWDICLLDDFGVFCESHVPNPDWTTIRDVPKEIAKTRS